MKKNNKFLIAIICVFVLVLSVTTYISFSSNTDTQEVIVKSITPVYDSNSTIEVENNNVVFNDKNQSVEYKVVIENTQNYDIKINNITLSTPTEEFLTYEVKNIEENDIIEANSTKELTIYLETTGIKGWGRNFQDELTANISFDRVDKQEEVPPPKEEDKEEEQPSKEEIKQPEKPAQSIQEVINKTDKIEIIKVTKDTIEFKENPKLEKGDKIAVWLYSDPIFLGYFDVVETNGVKQIVGLEEALKKADIQVGEHNIVLATEDGDTLGYVEVYVNEDNKLSEDAPEVGKIENPYTSTGWLIVYATIAGVAVIGIVTLRNKKVNKYLILVLALSSTLTLVKAEESIQLSILFNVSFESQNVMKPSELVWSSDYFTWAPSDNGVDYWAYAQQIKNFYIQNEVTEIPESVYSFDVSENKNGRVMAYLIDRNDDITCIGTNLDELECYDLYLQADGIIYPNENASYYFGAMENLESISNLEGMDTSEVTNMKGMFCNTGEFTETFNLDLRSFDTSKVTNMNYMFEGMGYGSDELTIDLSNFDTSNVTSMVYMFANTAYHNTSFKLNIDSFDTSNVMSMKGMFAYTCHNCNNFILDVSGLNTSNVTSMARMFDRTGYYSPTFTIDVSNFDTSKVTDMWCMFAYAGYNSENLVIDVSNFDTSNVTNMNSMFAYTGYKSENLVIDVSNFDTSNVTNMTSMFNNMGYNSTKLNTSITISNPDTTTYSDMFKDVTTKEGSQIKVNYTKETEELADKMIATKSPDSNVVKGNLMVDVDNLSVGDEIHISGEKFNVISRTDDTVTMLAQYNMGADYRQSTTGNYVSYSTDTGWEYTPGPKEIDIQEWSTNPKIYVNEYVDYLKHELKNEKITGDLITLKEMSTLGCSITDDYSPKAELSCKESQYHSWLINSQDWWTRSAFQSFHGFIWKLTADGVVTGDYFPNTAGIRPVITVSKQTLENYLKTS